jgi:excinuclease ABC subunit A
VKDRILVRGARQHNLKGFDVEIPRRSFTVITGPSGSGKSSLAFDTIYAEGQRRYVESLSAYARQFLERMEKPLVDSIEGLSPAVAIEQKNPTKTSRSTVGTATEVYDYLRLLWARVGRTFCPRCGRELRPDTVQSAREAVAATPEGTRFVVAFPLRLSSKVTHEVVVENLQAQGFVRVAVEGRIQHLDDVLAAGTDLTQVKDLLVVVDRLAVGPEVGSRLADALGTAFREGDGDAAVLFTTPVVDATPSIGAAGSEPRTTTRLNFTERYECPNDGTRLPAPSPQLFSFNNPRGACETCNGFGAVLEYDEALIVPNPQRSLRDGAIDPWEKPRYEAERRKTIEYARREGIPTDVAWSTLARAQQEQLLHGTSRGFVGAFPFLRSKEEKRYKQYIRVFLRQYQTAQECPTCKGTKLKTDALQVRLDGAPSPRCGAAGRRAHAWLDALALTPFERQVAAHISRRRARGCASCATWGSATCRSTAPRARSRAARRSASGSPTRSAPARRHALRARRAEHRAALARHGAAARLLHRLRDGGNTVLVVEHDPEAIEVADYMVELGPGERREGRLRGVRRRHDARAREPAHRAVPHRRAQHPRADRASPPGPALAHAHRRARAQPEGRRPAGARSAR